MFRGQTPGLTPELRDRFGAPASAGHCLTRHPGRAVVTEIGLLRAATRVREVETHHSTAAFGHLSTALVAYENRLSCHV